MSGLKRKQNFVDTNVQGGLIQRILLHWGMFFFVTMLAVIGIKTLLGDPSYSLSQRVYAELKDFLILSVIFLSVFPAFILDTVRFSNRFVGPIVRLRRHLVELGQQGATKDVKFRDNDFWQAVATEFNGVNQLVRSQQAQIQELQAELEQAKIENAETVTTG